MLGRTFLVISAAFLVLLGFAFYKDARLDRPWIGIQQQYAARYGNDFPMEVQQLFPKVKVNGEFKVERCITCHVPDIAKIGPQEAAKRLGSNHPAVIDDQVFARYGQETLICRSSSAGAAAAASPSASPSASPRASPRATPSRSPSPLPSASPTTPGTTAGAANVGTAAPTCQNPKATPFYVLDVNGKPVTDPTTHKPVTAQLTGFIPSDYKGLGIDESGCVICHNGNRQGTTQDGAHKNLVANPFNVYDTAPTLYENTCAQCHGATGEGLKGPPLNDQDRLGFFDDDYYYRCIYYGYLSSEHSGSIMPPWGAKKLLPEPVDKNITLLVNFIRMWQQYASLP
jgi:mono/diheme cytochrome c family protein